MLCNALRANTVLELRDQSVNQKYTGYSRTYSQVKLHRIVALLSHELHNVIQEDLEKDDGLHINICP